jgi:hypothetical protein
MLRDGLKAMQQKLTIELTASGVIRSLAACTEA